MAAPTLKPLPPVDFSALSSQFNLDNPWLPSPKPAATSASFSGLERLLASTKTTWQPIPPTTTYDPTSRAEVLGPEPAYRAVMPSIPRYYVPPPPSTVRANLAPGGAGPGGARAPYVSPGFPQRINIPLPWSTGAVDPLTGLLSGDTGAFIGSAAAGQRGGSIEGPFGVRLATVPMTMANFATWGREGLLSLLTGAFENFAYQQPEGFVAGQTARPQVPEGQKSPLDHFIDALNAGGEALWNATQAPINLLRSYVAEQNGQDVRALYASGSIMNQDLLAHGFFDLISGWLGGRDTMANIARKAAEKGLRLVDMIAELYDLDPQIVSAIRANPDISDAKLKALVAGQPFSRDPFINTTIELGLQVGTLVAGGVALKTIGGLGLAAGSLARASATGRTATLLAAAGRPIGWASVGATRLWRVNNLITAGGFGVRGGEWALKQLAVTLGDEGLVAEMDKWLWETPLSGNPGFNLLDAFLVHPIGFLKTLKNERMVIVGQGPSAVKILPFGRAVSLAEYGKMVTIGEDGIPRFTNPKGARFVDVGGHLTRIDTGAADRLARLFTLSADELHTGFFERLGWTPEQSRQIFGDGAEFMPQDAVNMLFWQALQQVSDDLGASARFLTSGLGELARNDFFLRNYGGRAARLLERTLEGKDTKLVERYRTYYQHVDVTAGDASDLAFLNRTGGEYDSFIGGLQFRQHLAASKILAAAQRESRAAPTVVLRLSETIQPGFFPAARALLDERGYGPTSVVNQRDLSLLRLRAPALTRYGGGALVAKGGKTAKITREQLERILREAESEQAKVREADIAAGAMEPRERRATIEPALIADPVAVGKVVGLPAKVVEDLFAYAGGKIDPELRAPPPELVTLVSALLWRAPDELRTDPQLVFDQALAWLDKTVGDAADRGAQTLALEEWRQAISSRVGQLPLERQEAAWASVNNLRDALERPIKQDWLDRHLDAAGVWEDAKAHVRDLTERIGAWLDDPARQTRVLDIGGVPRLVPEDFGPTDVAQLGGTIERLTARTDLPVAVRDALGDAAIHPFEKLRLVADAAPPGLTADDAALIGRFGVPVETTFAKELAAVLPDAPPGTAALADLERLAVAHQRQFAELLAETDNASAILGGENLGEGADLTHMVRALQNLPGTPREVQTGWNWRPKRTLLGNRLGETPADVQPTSWAVVSATPFLYIPEVRYPKMARLDRLTTNLSVIARQVEYWGGREMPLVFEDTPIGRSFARRADAAVAAEAHFAQTGRPSIVVTERYARPSGRTAYRYWIHQNSFETAPPRPVVPEPSVAAPEAPSAQMKAPVAPEAPATPPAAGGAPQALPAPSARYGAEAGFPNPYKETATIPARFRLMDIDELTSSDQPGYRQELQPRQRAERAASEEQIRSLVRDMERHPGKSAGLLLRSESGAEGPQVIAPDGTVIAGNGRTMAMRQAGDPFWSAYKAALARRAAKFGLERAEIEGMARPVLVREVAAELASRELAGALNVATGGMAITEQAARIATDISALDVNLLDLGPTVSLDDALAAAKNRLFVNHVLGTLTQRERATLVDAGGALNKQGVDLISAAMLSKLMRDPANNRLVARFFESTDDDFRRIRGGVLESLGQLIAAHELPREPQLAIGDAIAEAVDVLDGLKRMTRADGSPLSRADLELALDPAAMPQMFETADAIFARDLARVLYGLRSENEVTTFLRGYARALTDSPDPNQTTMFGGLEPLGRYQLADAALRPINEARTAANAAARLKAEQGIFGTAEGVRELPAIRPFAESRTPQDVAITTASADGPPVLETRRLAPTDVTSELVARAPEGGTIEALEPGDPAILAAIRGKTDFMGELTRARLAYDAMDEAGRREFHTELLRLGSEESLTAGEWLLLRELSGGMVRRDVVSGRLNMPYAPLPDAALTESLLAHVGPLTRLAEIPEGPTRIVLPRVQEPVDSAAFAAERGFTPDLGPLAALAADIAADTRHTLIGPNPAVGDAVKIRVGAARTPTEGRILEIRQPDRARALAAAQDARVRLEGELAVVQAELDASPPAQTIASYLSVFTDDATRPALQSSWQRLMTDELSDVIGPRSREPENLGQIVDAVRSIDTAQYAPLTAEEASALRASLMQILANVASFHGAEPANARLAGIRRLLAQGRNEVAAGVPRDYLSPEELTAGMATLMEELDQIVVPTGTALDGYTASAYQLSHLPRRSKFDRGPLSPRLLYQEDFREIAARLLPDLVDELDTGRQMTMPRRIADSRLGQFLDFAFGSRREQDIGRGARDFFTESLLAPSRNSVLVNPADYLAAERDVSAIFKAWQKTLDEQRVPPGFRLRRRVGLMEPRLLIAKAEEALLARHANELPAWWEPVKAEVPELFRLADSRLRRHFAAEEGGIGKLLELYYGSRLGGAASAASRGLTVTYHLYRFLGDIRWLALEAVEAPILVAGRSGLRAGLATLQGGRGKRVAQPLLFGADVHARAREAWAWWVNQTDPGATMNARIHGILEIMRREQPESLAPALRAFADADPDLAATIRRFGDTPESWLRGLNEDLEAGAAMTRRLNPKEAATVYEPFLRRGTISGAEFDNIVKSGHYTSLPKLEAELARTLGEPRVHALIERLQFLNEQAWNDVAGMMFGQPDRSNFQRLVNHPLLYWPISYQIKATKWLAGILFDRAFGVDTGAAPAVLLDQIHAQHIRRMREDEEYARFFAAHRDLFFVAQMLLPITPWDIGVSLSPWSRMLLTAGAEDPYQRNAFGIGPGYTYMNLLPRLVAAESRPGGVIPEILRPALGQAFPPTLTLRPKPVSATEYIEVLRPFLPPASETQAREQDVYGEYAPGQEPEIPNVPRLGP